MSKFIAGKKYLTRDGSEVIIRRANGGLLLGFVVKKLNDMPYKNNCVWNSTGSYIFPGRQEMDLIEPVELEESEARECE